MSRNCSTRRGWSAICIGSWGCRSPRPHRWRRSPTRSAPRCTGSPASTSVAWVDFAKGQRKDDVMHEHLAEFTGTEGVLFIGRAQEKTTLFRTEKRRDAHGDSYPWIVKTTGVVNHFYFYCVDCRFRPVLPQVLFVLPLQRQAVPQRQRVDQAAGRQGGDRVHRAGQRVRRGRRSGGGAGDLRQVGAGADRRAAAQVAGPACRTRSPQPTGPPATATTCRSCRPSSP